ncbi:MAG: translocation/assembly module TamB domain-containing protein [Ferruginibacter sp.]
MGILSLAVLAFVFLNLPIGKKIVRNQIESYLENKLKTKVSIGSIDYSLPEWLKIKNVYIQDRQKDTLIYGGELSVDLQMLKLLGGNTDIQKVYLHNIYIKVNRRANDSTFNYQFILDAFAGNNPSTQNTDTAEMKLTLDHLIFDTVALKFTDQFAGNDFSASIKNLDLTMDRFQPDRMLFQVKEMVANGVDYTMSTYMEQSPVEKPVAIDTVTQREYPLLLTATKLDMRNVNVLVVNKLSGAYYRNNVTHISSTGLLFSMGSYKGTADALVLDSSVIVFSSPRAGIPVLHDTVESTPVNWLFGAGKLAVHHTDFKYDDINKPAAEGLDYNHLDSKKINATISGFHYSTDSTAAIVDELSFNDHSGFQLDSTHLNAVFTNKRLSVKDLYIRTPYSVIQRSVEMTYDSLSAITTAPQNSIVNINLANSVIAFNDLFMLAPALKKSVGGFANQYLKINTEMKGTLQRLDIPYLQVAGLSGSRMSARGTLYNITDTNNITFDLYIIEGNFYKRDLLKFIPPENQASFKDLPEIFNMTGHFVGNKNNVSAGLKTSGKDFAFAGKLDLKNIADPAKLQYNLAISSLSLTKKLIAGFLPPEAMGNINLPEKIYASGKLNGNAENLVTDMKVVSSYGDLTVKGYIKNFKNTQKATYDLELTTPGFAAGKLLKQDSVFGNIAGKFIAKGTGFDYKTMISSISADIANIDYNKYNYKNAFLTAEMNNGNIVSKGTINDPSLKLNYNIDANVKGDYPTMKGLIRVDTVRLMQLNFYPDTLDLSLTAAINSQSLRPRHLDASLLLDSIRMQSGSNRYRLDSISLIGTSSAGIDSIILRSQIAEVHAGGAFDYDKVGLSIRKYVNNYYKLPGYQPPAVNIPEQQLGFNGVLRYSPIITGLVPGLLSYQAINFAGSYASAEADSALNFNATMPRITYTTNTISNGAINIQSRNDRINYDVRFDTLITPGNTLFATSIKGAAAHDSILVTARTEDAARKDWFALSGTAAVSGETYSFRIQDTLLLNYERWSVAPNNYISYSSEGIIINNFLLTSDTSIISVKSQQLVGNSPIDIIIDNFDLRSITSLLNQDTLFIGGVLDVKANVSDLEKPLPGFTGTAAIAGLSYQQILLGDLSASARKVSEDNIAGYMNLSGNGNDLTANGNYFVNRTDQQFDAQLSLKRLNFKTIEGVSGGQIKNSRGNITGEINASGKFADPRWNGQINFDTTVFTLTQLNAPYKINNQKIVFNYPEISFPQFTINDSLDHPLKIDGSISIPSMTAIAMNMKINASDFILLNAKKAVNSEVYGYGSIDAAISLTGTAAKPDIDGNIKLNDRSDITIVLPQSSYEKNDGNEIVRFIDRDTFDINPPVVDFEEVKKPSSAFGEFVNYNLNIEINKEAALTIMVDPSTGDEIRVQGDARLNAGVDPGGNIVLAGLYELDKGYYDLHYQFLERKFNLIKGSTITFAGAPLNSTVDITAEYIAYTSSSELLSNEVSDVNPILANSFKQKLPFRVILKLTGQLNKPEINFDIQLPEENTNLLNSDLRTTIENKLQQIRSDPSSINKQVFSLLLLGRFVGEQSSDFFKGGGGDFSMLARQSVSQFLSSALNQIAGDIFKGIDIDLNLNSYNDFSNGGNNQRTDLNVAVSKRFANDRLIVSVGQNFGVEGQDAGAKASQANSSFSPDITISYKLTKDGRYLLRAYTKNQFEVTVDGYVMETGLAFMVTMDYEKFNELFRRKKRR